jgi:C1A family cysteine protease
MNKKKLLPKTLTVVLVLSLLITCVAYAVSLTVSGYQEEFSQPRLEGASECQTEAAAVFNQQDNADKGSGETGSADPAALYCQKLGYKYEIREDDKGNQYGVCVFPDGSECNAWDFFKGSCGGEYSYCAQKGYDIETEVVNKGSYTEECAVCVSRGSDSKNATRVPMLELMAQNGEPLEDIVPSVTEADLGEECRQSLSQTATSQRGDVPTAFDWRNVDGHSYIGPIRAQGSCGACYAFAACAAAESVYNIAEGLTDSNCADFSESFIVWCLSTLPQYSSHFPSGGCGGSDYDLMELEALTHEGVCYESSFPYQTWDPGTCTHWNDPRTVFSSWGRVSCGDVAAIKSAIMTYGVVDVGIITPTSFHSYSGGIYSDSYTSCPGVPCYKTSTDHLVSLVGWGNDPIAGDYWILRNSWGSTWGEGGYMRISVTSARVACEVSYISGPPIATPTPPSVVTNAAGNITTTSATLNGNLTAMGTATSVTVSFEWGNTTSYGNETPAQVLNVPAAFSGNITGLQPNTAYHFKAKAVGNGTSYGNDTVFTTSTVPPTVTTNAATVGTANSATLNGNLTGKGTATSVAVSFEWGNTTAYGNETPAQVLNAPAAFSGNITGLKPNTTYHFRAKATGNGTSYGNDTTFNTTGSTPVTGITRQVNGNITPGVSITLDGTGPVVSDQNGQYEIMATATGNYTVVAHKDGFRDRTQTVNIAGLGPGYAVTCNFQAQNGLIPNAPDIWYALDCVNRWLYPPNPETGLDIWTALDVVNAWLYPVQ